jgi:hypothetical protein
MSTLLSGFTVDDIITATNNMLVGISPYLELLIGVLFATFIIGALVTLLKKKDKMRYDDETVDDPDFEDEDDLPIIDW